jgi:hypothetical protein
MALHVAQEDANKIGEIDPNYKAGSVLLNPNDLFKTTELY